MRKQVFVIVFLILLICYIIPKYSFAANAGNPLDLDLPQRSAMLRQDIIEETMDECEQIIKLKASFDLEFVFDKDLHVMDELTKAEFKGQWYMAKLGMTILNRIEPYIKVGTSDLEVKWKHGAEEIDVDADNGFAWGGGVKANILELHGIRLTGYIQYRTTEPDVKEASVNRVSAKDNGAKFKIEEWQAGLFLSKKFEIPLKLQSIYAVPYTGVVYADSNVDVSFININNPTADYSLFDANNKKCYGLIFG